VRTGCDAAGRFEFDGLLGRDYLLDVEAPTALVEGVVATADGPEVLIALPGGEVNPVRGVVVTTDGTPLAGVRVYAWRRWRPLPVPWDDPPLKASTPTSFTLTGADGAFELAYLVEGAQIEARASGVFSSKVSMDSIPSRDGRLYLVLLRSARISVQLTDVAAAPDRFGVFDEDENLQWIHRVEGNGYVPMQWFSPKHTRSPILDVPETVRSIRFYRGEKEVGRLPLVLEPGRLVEVQF
jgi:hypothetical protein